LTLVISKVIPALTSDELDQDVCFLFHVT
jgi:hypothetical protein